MPKAVSIISPFHTTGSRRPCETRGIGRAEHV